MSSQNIISICNLALLSIGCQSQISNLNEGSTQSDACSTLFTFVYEQLARTAHWNCLRQQATLDLLKAAAGTLENPQGTTLPLPPSPWQYAYQLPSDCLQARYIVPTVPPLATGSIPLTTAYYPSEVWLPDSQIPFATAYGTDANNNPLSLILTNQTQAQLVYTVNQPNPTIWDSSFTAAMVASLAAYLVPALSFNLTLMSGQIKIADKIIADARTRDGNEGSNRQDHQADWISARNGGCWDGYPAFNSYSYGSMSWPG